MRPPADVCHVWQVDLSREAAIHAPLHWLDASEKERAARLRFERDRERFMTCRVALRQILAEHLECEPAQIALSRGAHGRPALAVAAPHSLDFNVSHSGDLALIAVTAQAPLGVDVELLREMTDATALSRRYLTEEEHRAIEAVPPAQRSAAFLACWTRKEAVLKSTGAGLTLDPRCIKVGADFRETTIEWPLDSSTCVRVRSLAPADGYIAACATNISVECIELRRFDLK